MGSEPRVCSDPAECCKELSRVWEALSVTVYVPGRGSASEQVVRLKAEVESLTAQVQHLEQERDKAMSVLAPNVPESGLEDACRQVKQVAISALDTAERLEALVQRQQEYMQHKPGCPLSTDRKWASVAHTEEHLDDDGPMSACRSPICRAWALAPKNGKPDCTCGYDAACGDSGLAGGLIL